MNALAKKLDELEARASIHNPNAPTTVIGFVCPKKGFTHSIRRDGDDWLLTQEEVDVYLPAKLERVLKSTKRFIVVIGGRGSGKSVGIADICLIEARDSGAKTYCLREYQSSIKNSVHSLLKEEAKRLELPGFETLDTTIKYNGAEAFQFAGLARNVDSIKSAHGFRRYWTEESQFISKDSLKTLTPTARNKPRKGLPLWLCADEGEIVEEVEKGVSMIFVANPGSSEDPFSQRFINPFKKQLDKDGYYEDDLHLIVKMNYTDNPWYQESGLEEERQFDYEYLPRPLYEHIWLGEHNDSIENSLILAEWFDACIDSHEKIGFKPTGVKIAAHDPSDTGLDSKGYAMRHGSVILNIQEKEDGNVNEGGFWAADLAINDGVDHFTWDGDGMGCALGDQFSMGFDGKRIEVRMFKGSESPDNPEAIYGNPLKAEVAERRTNKDTFKNKRAQFYGELRDRIYRTYRAVVHKDLTDPDKLISFSSKIDILGRVRSELCRLPTKPNGNGKLELYTKDEMKNKFKVLSPNLADSVMMLMRYTPARRKPARMPQAIRPMGKR